MVFRVFVPVRSVVAEDIVDGRLWFGFAIARFGLAERVTHRLSQSGFHKPALKAS
jgi:hypothetical protein